MEVYLPILMQKGNKKLRLYKAKLEVPKNFKQLREQQQALKNVKRKQNKIFAAIQVSDFETDDSMREIKFRDLKSASEREDDQNH